MKHKRMVELVKKGKTPRGGTYEDGNMDAIPVDVHQDATARPNELFNNMWSNNGSWKALLAETHQKTETLLVARTESGVGRTKSWKHLPRTRLGVAWRAHASFEEAQVVEIPSRHGRRRRACREIRDSIPPTHQGHAD